MINEIKLHGKANEKLDYYVTITGADLSSRYCYECLPEGDRFFSGGNEFVIQQDGVRYMGTGGSLCEYMFGVDLPLKDLLRKDVSNRLVMYGAYYDKADNITFTNSTGGKESFDQVFLSGNAVSNYFFFVHSSQKNEIKDLQREILKTIGKQVKRSETVGANDDSRLCREIFDAVGDPKALVFLFRLVNRHNEEYFKTFNRLYEDRKTIATDGMSVLDDLSRKYNIIPYQQERIKIDGMYKLPENKKIVDEYKDILIAVSEKGEVNPSELAKLSRLRTLSLRLNIPHTLFDTLDELLLKDMNIVEVEEPDYIRDTRAIFEGLFFRTDNIRGHVSSEDLIKLLKAKQKSTMNRDPAFESLLLDTVRACDEHARDANDMSVMEAMSHILTYFDRYDSTATTINNLAFMENSTLSEDNIRSLSGNKEIFDQIEPALFRELFFDSIIGNRYLTRYGRKKVDILNRGLVEIKAGNTTYRALASKLSKINEVDKLYTSIHRYIKDRFKSIYAELNSKEDQEIFIQDLNREIQSKGIVHSPVPHSVFEEIILDIRKESFYLNNLLPHIIVSRDNQVREDFLLNSGLDRFYVEELEKDYFDMNKIEQNILEEIRK
ncbi:MAG: TIGR04442 family protein [Nitrospirae bacterium GWD2_57_9]|nr:MAG: TIGR04442 family protein [Nitrospirae bacterium GWD2_57_9]OGW50437.1 MAG: TIGR04442 family protein [Nitrospirae bacterium GWC2_57_9]